MLATAWKTVPFLSKSIFIDLTLLSKSCNNYFGVCEPRLIFGVSKIFYL